MQSTVSWCRVVHAWGGGGGGGGGILNRIVIIFDYENNTLFNNSLGVGVWGKKTLFNQDHLNRSKKKNFKKEKVIVIPVKDTVYFTMTCWWNKWSINGNRRKRDFYYDSLCSWQWARVRWLQCRASLLLLYWSVRLLWIVFFGTFSTRLKYKINLMTPIQSVRGLSGGTRNNNFPSRLTPHPLFICWNPDE